MKKLSYKTLSIIPLFVGAASLAIAAEYSADGAKRATVSAEDAPPPITSQTMPQPQQPVSIETEGTAPLLSGSVAIAGPASTEPVADITASVGPASVGPTADINFNSVTVDTRAKLFTDIDAQLKKNSQDITSLRARSGELSADASSRLATANADLSAKEAALRASLATARSADSTAWMSSRSKLQADYQAYLSALNSYEMIFPVGFATPSVNLEPTSISVDVPASAEVKPDAVKADVQAETNIDEAPAHEGSGPDRNDSPANRSAVPEDKATGTARPASSSTSDMQ